MPAGCSAERHDEEGAAVDDVARYRCGRQRRRHLPRRQRRQLGAMVDGYGRLLHGVATNACTVRPPTAGSGCAIELLAREAQRGADRQARRRLVRSGSVGVAAIVALKPAVDAGRLRRGHDRFHHRLPGVLPHAGVVGSSITAYGPCWWRCLRAAFHCHHRAGMAEGKSPCRCRQRQQGVLSAARIENRVFVAIMVVMFAGIPFIDAGPQHHPLRQRTLRPNARSACRNLDTSWS